MASINYAAREISVKVVYYGPGLSGKTTNLQVIHRKVPPEYKSDMVSLATETDRTLFFDFLPLDLGKIKGFATKFQLYTVPGQVYYNATRKLVLRGVDGIVFVADSAPDKMQENIESFKNLEDNLAEYGYKRENIPIILQYNKRDLPNALPIEELQRVINKYNLPWTEAVANKGKGVFDSLKLIGKIVIDYLNRKYSKQPSRQSYSIDPNATAATNHSSYQQQQPKQPVQTQHPIQQQPVRQQPFSAPQQQYPVNQQPSYQRQAQQFAQKPQPQRTVPPPLQGGRPQNFPPQMPVQPPLRQAPQPYQQQYPFRQVPPVQPPARPNPQQYSMPNQMRQPSTQQPQIRPELPPNVAANPKQNTGYSQQQPPAYQKTPQQEDSFEVSFEPNQPNTYSGAQQQDNSAQDYYNYGNLRFQQNNDPISSTGMNQGAYDISGNKSDLDMEIEKYQREIEEKQRRMQPSQVPSQQMPGPGPAYQQQPQMPVEQSHQQSFASEDNDYDVYNLELPSYPMQGHPPTQRQPAITEDAADDMYFTSVDTDHQKRPARRPVNPRNKPQKGFLSKFFNKDIP